MLRKDRWRVFIIEDPLRRNSVFRCVLESVTNARHPANLAAMSAFVIVLLIKPWAKKSYGIPSRQRRTKA
jgi:hypothetical protein